MTSFGLWDNNKFSGVLMSTFSPYSPAPDMPQAPASQQEGEQLCRTEPSSPPTWSYARLADSQLTPGHMNESSQHQKNDAAYL